MSFAYLQGRLFLMHAQWELSHGPGSGKQLHAPASFRNLPPHRPGGRQVTFCSPKSEGMMKEAQVTRKQTVRPSTRGSDPWVSLGHAGRRVVSGHMLNTLRHVMTKKSHCVLSKFTILRWATLSHPGLRAAGGPWIGHPWLQPVWLRAGVST